MEVLGAGVVGRGEVLVDVRVAGRAVVVVGVAAVVVADVPEDDEAPAARPAPPPAQAARNRAVMVIQRVWCRTGTEGSPGGRALPAGPNGGHPLIHTAARESEPYRVLARREGTTMHYREVPWLVEYASHRGLVVAFQETGLLPAGCVVLDDGSDGPPAWTESYDDEARAYFLQQHERPAPVLATPDGTCLVEVSDMHGAPSVRARSVMTDGTLVETLLRWPTVPPWPRRLNRARALTTVDVEMTRQAARGRIVSVVDTAPEEILLKHFAAVADTEREQGTSPLELTTMEEVLSVWNAALVHGQQTERANLLMTGFTQMGALALGTALVLLGWLVAHSWWPPLLGVALTVATWWASPFVLVLYRRSGRFRPPFPWVVRERVMPLDPR
jgi:hypothetical protein